MAASCSAECLRSSRDILRTKGYVPRKACTAANDPALGVPIMMSFRTQCRGRSRIAMRATNPPMLCASKITG